MSDAAPTPGRMGRRRFLARLGAAGALGGAAIGGARLAQAGAGAPRGGHGAGHGTGSSAHGTGLPGRSAHGTGLPGRSAMAHGGTGTVGRVDHARNGFDPLAMLTDFDGGEVSRDGSGRTVREYELTAVEKDIEVAPGVMFPAWTYNGRVPGPTIRATEGDRIRITFANGTRHPHTIHFHGIHPSEMDGVPGAGEIQSGETFVYDFVAEPFGTHLYHCHSVPLKSHIHRGLYGGFIVDPLAGRPPAHEMVMVLNAFDTDFDGENEVYAANTVAFAYVEQPIEISAGELQRAHVINVTEFDPVNSIHTHATFFQLYRTGTSLTPHELTDIVTMGQAERHMLEFTYRSPGQFMFHAHQTEFVELGWMSFFKVV